MDFDPWGVVTQDSSPGWQPFGFAGCLYNADTGLVRFGARDYDALTGNWLGRDPIQSVRGEINGYAYADDQPVSRIDRDGCEAIGAIVGGIVGGVSGALGAKAAGGSAGDMIIGGVVGAIGGAVVGLIDPTGGVLTAGSVLESAALSGLAGAAGNVGEQV